MGSAGDDDVVDPRAHSDEAGGGSFDPGLETGYLRRAPRDRDLSPELGAAPFDPGPDRYDDRRARRAAKRQQREERQRREREAKGSGTTSSVARLTSGDALPDQTDPASAEPPAQIALAGGAAPPGHVPPDPEPRPPAETTALRRRESMAERLERLRVEREREELERRLRIEHERAEREAAERERRERRRRERAEKLRRERQAERLTRRKPSAKTARPGTPQRSRVRPGVQGPVRKRARAAENRRRAAAKRSGLAWPTAQAALAVTVVLGLSAAVGSALGLPVPGLGADAGQGSLVSSASLFGVDQGTPQGLSAGYVFPLEGPHGFGDAEARFGASRYGHVHEGQDIFGKIGTPEVAVHDGVVVDRGKNSDPDSGGRGNYLAIYSPADDHSFVYMHMLKPARVQLGQQVHAGEVVGELGCTGSCDGPHLHFEVRIGKASLGADTKPVDPLPYLRQWPQPTPG
jgi:murein DD-endopeptidase MepM/ murein hydrolase activator NlpD